MEDLESVEKQITRKFRGLNESKKKIAKQKFNLSKQLRMFESNVNVN